MSSTFIIFYAPMIVVVLSVVVAFVVATKSSNDYE